MTEQAAGPRRPLLARVVDPVRPMWELAFRDPVRHNHIRLAGMTRPAYQLAAVGLVTLGFLLLSVLFNDVWRQGDLLPLDASSGRFSFLPLALLPVTLICFFLAWSLVLWGASGSSPLVRIATAVVFLLANATFGVPTSIDLGGRLALQIGPALIKTGYFAAPGLLVVSALFWRSERWSDRVRPAVRLLILVSLAMVFFTHLWVHVTFVNAGFEGAMQTLVSGAVTEIDGLLLPLVYLSGILVVDFSLDVAEGIALSARRASAQVAKFLLLTLLVVKLWVQVVSHSGEWIVYLSDRPVAVARTLLAIGFLAVAITLTARLADRGGFEDAKERLLYGSGVVLAFNHIALVLVVGVGLFVLAQFEVREIPAFVSAFPGDELALYGRPLLAAAALVAGVYLVRRDRSPAHQEVGSGMAVMGAWLLPIFLVDLTAVELGFNDALFDAAISIGVLGYLAVRWRRIDTAQAVMLGAITVFTWLVMTKGDWISILGSLAGLPSVLIVVFGIVFSLAADAQFTREGSKRLPQGVRPLLFVGYLILSVTILNWILATHVINEQVADADRGFFYLGLPLAAWLVARRLLRRGETELEEVVAAAQDGVA